MLPFYAERFPTTEINYSFRRIPSSKSVSNWAAATPEHFKFNFKAPQKITHFAKLRDTGDTLSFFRSVVCELGPLLGAVLFHLPPPLRRISLSSSRSSGRCLTVCAPLLNFVTPPGSMTRWMRH